MYSDHFGFAEVPFSIAPDPRYLFMSAGHREALAHLLYGIRSDGGFVLLTGEVGTGKTTVCRCLLEQIPENCILALVLNPRVTVLELLSTICDEFHIPYSPKTKSIKVFVDIINRFLLDVHAAQRKAVLIIDEAQNLRVDVLEQMRLLTNLETNERKLLQIIMIGQPELRVLLARPELRQVSQRIVARYHLGPLSKTEVHDYIRHRLSVAGGKTEPFHPRLVGLVYSLSGGIPRVINLLCDRALLGAYAQGLMQVDRRTLLQAAREVFGEAPRGTLMEASRSANIRIAAGFMFLLLGLTVLLWGKPLLQVLPPGKEEARVHSAPFRKTMPSNEAPDGGPLNSMAANAEPLQAHESQGGQALEKAASKWKVYSEAGAFEILFGLWGKEYDAQRPENICGQAQEQGLSCYAGRGSMDELRRLNRPAVLKLHSRDGGPFYVTLVSFRDGLGRFAMKDAELSASVDTLAHWWRGEFHLLWETPPSYRGMLRPGDRGPTVQWLWERLSQLNGTGPPPGDTEAYDQNLSEEIRKFQILSGLQPDGVAGPQTLISLHSRLPGASPVLSD